MHARVLRAPHSQRVIGPGPAGTLLLTWVDHSGRVQALRSKLKETFPGASTRQVGCWQGLLCCACRCGLLGCCSVGGAPLAD